MLKTSVVFLVLLAYDADTGTLLHKLEKQMPDFSFSGDRIEDCRKQGLRLARDLSALYRANGHPNATTNVDCEWRRGKPYNPA
ncbi:MAG: hypothetical protein ACRECF_09290 [Methyloceanibacter sp.]